MTASRPLPRPLARNLLLPALAVVAIVLAACGGAAQLQDAGGGNVGVAPEPAVEGPADGSNSLDRDAVGAGGTGGGLLADDAKIVKTGSLQLEVTSLGEALTKAQAEIAGMGGYIGASEERHEEDRSFATVTYRIPVDRWDDAVKVLRALAAEVLGGQTQAIEVTGQLVDLGARIDNLRATERSLQAIMAQATKIPDILEVQARLTEVRGEIEQLEAQRAHLSDQAAYGTLTVAYSTPAPVAVTEASKGWDPAAEIDRAAALLISLLQWLGTASIWLAIVGLPIVLSLGLVLGLALLLARRFARPRVHASTGS